MSTHEQTYVPRQAYDLLKSILLGLVILAAGMVIGSGVTFLILSHQQERVRREPEIFAEHLLGRLGRELNLSAQQREQLDPILREHFKTLHDIRASVRPRIVSQLEELDREIMSVLDEHQKTLWQQQVRRLEDHFPTFRGPGRGMGPGPQDGRGPAQREPQERRGPGMRPGGMGQGQGQRQPSGMGMRRGERSEQPEPNDPHPTPPDALEL